MVKKVAYVVRDKDGAFFPNTYGIYNAQFFQLPVGSIHGGAGC